MSRVRSWLRRPHRRPDRRVRGEEGYAAILTASLLASGVFFGLAAYGVDIGRWYQQMESVQRAADAAALAGVPYLPQDLPNAVTRAKQVAARNGFDDAAADVVVTAQRGGLPGQLEVTVSSTITNSFGRFFGSDETTVTRSAVAEYSGPSPMGSPCNTFGNEPTSGYVNTSSDATSARSAAQPAGTVRGSSPFSNCSGTPQFWANIEGPETGKVQGDRYQTRNCEESGVDGCAGLVNSEYDQFGYAFVVSVQPSAVNTNVELQLYDPQYFNTGQRCERLPDVEQFPNNANATNPYSVNSDSRNRYTRNGTNFRAFCNGDSLPGSSPTTVPTTSFVLRQQVDSQNPVEAPVQNNTSGGPCIAQYGGRATSSSSYINANLLTRGTGATEPAAYDPLLAQTFHNWSALCTFRPTRAGDYYLQVRTNVSLGGTCTGDSGEVRICRGNTAAAALAGNTTSGGGSNAFAIRAKTTAGLEKSVSVAGYNHMPIFVNADAATSTFNLIRVLPGAAGQFIRFSYFDSGDAQSNGSVKVLTPTDATGSITSNPFPSSCRSFGGSASGTETSPQTLSNCTAPIEQGTGGTSKNNGKVQTIDIPVPTDYMCNYSSTGGCWYRVQVTFGSGTVNDVTTWDAAVIGDPLRLVE